MTKNAEFAAAHIPVDCKAPATSQKNARVANLSTRTHGMGRDVRKPYNAHQPVNPEGCC